MMMMMMMMIIIIINVKITLEWATKTRGIALNLGTNCTNTGGWVDPRAGLDGCGKSCPPPGFDDDDDNDNNNNNNNDKNIVLLLKHRYKAIGTSHGSHTQLSRRFALV
jgi:hypothetical protein